MQVVLISRFPVFKIHWRKWQSIKGIFGVIFFLFALFAGKVFLDNCIEEKIFKFSLREVIDCLAHEHPEEATIVGIATSLGCEEIIADFLFLQAIQYFGDWKLKKEEKFKKVFPVLKVMGKLAPHFIPGYSFGALVLDELGYVDEAIEFLNEGIKNNPKAFELYLYRDFTIRLFKTKEYKKAIEGIKAALKIEGYPPILERILAYAYEKDGQIDKAISWWKKIYNSTDDPHIKEICKRHIERLISVIN